jgi:ATP-dependent RNA helicase DDX10/DBP4
MHAKEVFFKMTPGVPLMRLHGKMGQHQRMATYDEFCKKDRALLLATDLVARGMDFPNVDWVVQLDCPESVDEYIHRAGRTARSDQAGNSVLVLNPSEKKMIKELRNRKPPVNVTEWIYNKEMIVDISPKLQSLAAEREEIKGYGSRAFTAYCKRFDYSELSEKMMDLRPKHVVQ